MVLTLLSSIESDTVVVYNLRFQDLFGNYPKHSQAAIKSSSKPIKNSTKRKKRNAYLISWIEKNTHTKC